MDKNNLVILDVEDHYDCKCDIYISLYLDGKESVIVKNEDYLWDIGVKQD